MHRKFALIGTSVDIAHEAKKLEKQGYKAHQIYRFEFESIVTTTLIAKIVNFQITDVVCIKTMNGQTGHWGCRLKDLKINEEPIKLFGIEIPPHKQIGDHKGIAFITPISCVTETLKAA